jgi:hypothetical protein
MIMPVCAVSLPILGKGDPSPFLCPHIWHLLGLSQRGKNRGCRYIWTERGEEQRIFFPSWASSNYEHRSSISRKRTTYGLTQQEGACERLGGLGEVLLWYCPFALSIYRTPSRPLLERTTKCAERVDKAWGRRDVLIMVLLILPILRLCPWLFPSNLCPKRH